MHRECLDCKLINLGSVKISNIDFKEIYSENIKFNL